MIITYDTDTGKLEVITKLAQPVPIRAVLDAIELAERSILDGIRIASKSALTPEPEAPTMDE
jgi:hypothetical protein